MPTSSRIIFNDKKLYDNNSNNKSVVFSFSLSVTAFRCATSLVRERLAPIFLLSKKLCIRAHFTVGDDAFHRPEYYVIIFTDSPKIRVIRSLPPSKIIDFCHLPHQMEACWNKSVSKRWNSFSLSSIHTASTYVDPPPSSNRATR